MPTPMLSARIGATVVLAALVSACSGSPKMSAQQESGQYRSSARGNYTPPGPSSDPWGPYVTEASAKFDVPERWIREVMRQESGGKLYNRNGQLITSSAGAMGLMQVMPATYDEIRGRYPELGSDPFDPHNNILAGAAYIREMYDIYGSPGFLAAYNAGPGRMDDYLTRSRTLPDETRRYVAIIGPRISGASPSRTSPGEQYASVATPYAGPRYTTPFQTASVAPSGTAIVLGQPTPAAVARPSSFAVAALPSPAPLRAEPIQLAANEPGPASTGQRIRLAPQPAEAFEPVQTASLAPPPAYVAPVAAMSPAAEVLRPLPLPPAPAPARASAPAPAQYAALQPAAPQRRLGFQFVASANAAPAHPANIPGGWAVQVGAFANPGMAVAATTAARTQAREALGGAQPLVATVVQANTTLYRARLTGLSREAAAQACERLVRSRTSCIVVSPGAQG